MEIEFAAASVGQGAIQSMGGDHNFPIDPEKADQLGEPIGRVEQITRLVAVVFIGYRTNPARGSPSLSATRRPARTGLVFSASSSRSAASVSRAFGRGQSRHVILQ